jgi:hypothetical protein
MPTPGRTKSMDTATPKAPLSAPPQSTPNTLSNQETSSASGSVTISTASTSTKTSSRTSRGSVSNENNVLLDPEVLTPTSQTLCLTILVSCSHQIELGIPGSVELYNNTPCHDALWWANSKEVQAVLNYWATAHCLFELKSVVGLPMLFCFRCKNLGVYILIFLELMQIVTKGGTPKWHQKGRSLMTKPFIWFTSWNTFWLYHSLIIEIF